MIAEHFSKAQNLSQNIFKENEMPLLRKGHFYLGILGNAILSAEGKERYA